MMTTYKAKLTGTELVWTEDKPQLPNGGLSANVLVTILPQSPAGPTAAELRQRRVAALARIAARGGIRSITDPVAWQREMREDRPLPGRED